MAATFHSQSLPWSVDGFAGFLSPAGINLHYQLYQRYIDKMNKYAQENPQLKTMSLARIADQYIGPVGDDAAQAINHEFFWKCLIPGGSQVGGRVYELITTQFGSFEEFVRQFSQRAIDHFGSGWVWLVFDPSTNFLQVVDGDNAYTPLRDGQIPLLALDVWEHAYYLDYGIDKKSYVENFWKYVNWNWTEQVASDHIFGYRVRTSLPPVKD